MNNPSCIDLIVSKTPNSFQNVSTFCTVLPDFHKLKDIFRKWDVYNFIIGDYNKFNVDDFKTELR